MKFTVRRQDLQQELALIQGVVEARATIPILSHLLVRAGKDGLELLATDLEIGLRTGCVADVSSPGAATIPAKKLHDVVRALSSDVVSVESESNNWLRIEGGSFKSRIVGLGAEDFPPPPSAAPEAKTVRVPLTTFQQMVGRVLFAVTTENTRFSINGALMTLSAEELTLVATDGHRLAHATRRVEIPELTEPISALVPRKALAEIGRFKPGDENEEMAITASGNHVFFEAGERALFSRTLEGTFPNYEKVIPEGNEQVARVPRTALADVLSRVAILTSDTSRMVSFAFGANGLTVATNNPNMGDATEELPVEWTGDGVTIGLNFEYVMNFLQAVDCEQVAVFLKDSTTQALFEPVGEEDRGTYRYVVMPMRLG